MTSERMLTLGFLSPLPPVTVYLDRSHKNHTPTVSPIHFIHRPIANSPFATPVYNRDSSLARHSNHITDMRRDVQEIFRATPHHKQVMMFSATLSKDIRATCKKFMQSVSGDCVVLSGGGCL